MAGELQIIRPYGDRRDDGVLQLSFTLPVPLSDKAKEAARIFCAKLGLTDVKVAAAEPAADQYTFFIVYARADVSLDYSEIDVPENEYALTTTFAPVATPLLTPLTVRFFGPLPTT